VRRRQRPDRPSQLRGRQAIYDSGGLIRGALAPGRLPRTGLRGLGLPRSGL